MFLTVGVNRLTYKVGLGKIMCFDRLTYICESLIAYTSYIMMCVVRGGGVYVVLGGETQ